MVLRRGGALLGPEAKLDALCKRNTMSSDLAKALRTQHREAGKMSWHGCKWPRLGAQRLAF